MKGIKGTLLGLTVSFTVLSSCNYIENDKNKTSEMKTQQHAPHSKTYVCPMHPSETGNLGDKCSICGMDLKAVQQVTSNEYQVHFKTSPQKVEAEKPVQLSFLIKKGEQIVPLNISHEMKMHLMIVNKDLSWFHHIHPEEQTDGSYTITETFPSGGKYLLFADFKPNGAGQTLNRQEIEVQGKKSANKEEVSHKLISIVDGYTVTLENGNNFVTNRVQPLKILIEKDGKKLEENDLQQYLGASAHIVMIGKVGYKFLHIHPVSDNRFPVYAEANIEEDGIYRIWVQFKINDEVHTADFTVVVTQGGKSVNPQKHQHSPDILNEKPKI